MDPYDPGLAPAPFGLQNTGAICYFNSFLQVLASCTAFTRQVLNNKELMCCTRTGAAVFEFCSAYAAAGEDGRVVARRQPANDISSLSSRVFEALLADVRLRRPGFELGRGQDDARMAIEMFVDMLELTQDGKDSRSSARDGESQHGRAIDNAVTQLFRHSYNLTLRCLACKREHHPEPENKFAVFNLIPQRRRALPATAPEFASFIRRLALWNDGYKCEGCGVKSKTVTEYNLAVVPEIVLCAFNLKTDVWHCTHSKTGQPIVGHGSGERRARFFPERFEIPALGGGTIVFKLVGQAEHSGGNHGGHYWAQGLRSGEAVCRLNDTSVSPGKFGPTPETYLIAYHYAGFIPP